MRKSTIKFPTLNFNTIISGKLKQQSADHFVPTAPSVYSKYHQLHENKHQSSNSHGTAQVIDNVVTSTISSIMPNMDHARHQMNISKAKQVVSLLFYLLFLLQ